MICTSGSQKTQTFWSRCFTCSLFCKGFLHSDFLFRRKTNLRSGEVPCIPWVICGVINIILEALVHGLFPVMEHFCIVTELASLQNFPIYLLYADLQSSPEISEDLSTMKYYWGIISCVKSFIEMDLCKRLTGSWLKRLNVPSRGLDLNLPDDVVQVINCGVKKARMPAKGSVWEAWFQRWKGLLWRQGQV